MKIGLVSFFPWRIHNYNLMYIAHLLENVGHTLSYFSCSGELNACYPRMLKNSKKFIECSMCHLGGVISFKKKNIYHTKNDRRIALTIEKKNMISASSANTLLRIESQADKRLDKYISIQKSLFEAVEIIYGNAINWIEDEKLDGIILFNGRMEITRAVLEAARDMNIPFVSYERSLFGDGISFFPNQNCIGLKHFDILNNTFREKPLSRIQSISSAKYGVNRLLYKGLNEWRLYNTSPEAKNWPHRGNSTSKILILPSSKNEFDGHEDYMTEWDDNGIALDLLKEKLNVGWDSFVLRCHPNWSEKIGTVSGELSEKYYLDWAKERDVYVYKSNDNVNTHKLIEEADIVVVNNSSSAIQAGMLGKNIILLGHSIYQNAGFTLNIARYSDFKKLETNWYMNADHIIRMTLRFLYVVSKRFPQYTKFVKAISPLEFEYYKGGDAERLIYMLENNQLIPDDNAYRINKDEEDEIVSLVKTKEWEKLLEMEDSIEEPFDRIKLNIRRRRGFRWIDEIRKIAPSGDRINFG